MARPPLPLGQHGAISGTSKNDRWIARCRVRGLDGVTRHVQKSGKSRTAARLALQDELRTLRGERAEVLRPESRFRDAATIYLGKVTARREDSTTDVYSYWLEKLVLPQLGELRLAECDVARPPPDGHAAREGHEGGGSFSWASSSNDPTRTTNRKQPERSSSTGLDYCSADLSDLTRFALGSGLRVGEICAVRWMDLDLDGIPVVNQTDMRLVPVVAVRQNVYPVKGKGLAVHGGKSAMALRVVPLPEFAVSRLRARQYPDDDPHLAGLRLRRPGWSSRPTGGRRMSGAASARSASTSNSAG